MMIRRLFVGLACAGTLAAQTFIQMSDPQFGNLNCQPSKVINMRPNVVLRWGSFLAAYNSLLLQRRVCDSELVQIVIVLR